MTIPNPNPPTSRVAPRRRLSSRDVDVLLKERLFFYFKYFVLANVAVIGAAYFQLSSYVNSVVDREVTTQVNAALEHQQKSFDQLQRLAQDALVQAGEARAGNDMAKQSAGRLIVEISQVQELLREVNSDKTTKTVTAMRDLNPSDLNKIAKLPELTNQLAKLELEVSRNRIVTNRVIEAVREFSRSFKISPAYTALGDLTGEITIGVPKNEQTRFINYVEKPLDPANVTSATQPTP